MNLDKSYLYLRLFCNYWENYMKKVATVSIVVLISMFSLPMIPASTVETESGPELEVFLGTCISNGFRQDNLEIAVENVGDATAHNVTLINLIIDGNVVYNNRRTEWNRDIEPGHILYDNPRSLFFGFGVFKATMTVTCDEAVEATGSGNGIMLGFLIFVP